MALSSKLLSLAFSGSKRRFEAMSHDPISGQRRAFSRLLQTGRLTQFGLDHRLDTVSDYESFKARVPLRKYDDFLPYLERIKSGESNTLALGRPKYWGRTGGTSGKDKLIPIYPASLSQSRNTFQMALALHLLQNPEAKIVGKKMLFLGSCSPLKDEAGIPSGFMSSIMVREFSPLVRKIILPGDRVDHLLTWPEKMNAVFEMTRNEDLCIIAGMPPWLLAFFRLVTERSGKSIRELWPNLSLVIHSGVSMDSYRSDIQRLIEPTPSQALPSFRNGYGATEGNFALQDQDETPNELLLLTDEIFYEFIPLEAYLAGRGEQERIQLESVQAGEEYVFVLTTPGGLWSYVIGDTVRFSSLKPYLFSISGRTAQSMNLAGEKLSVDQVVAAISVASKKSDLSVDEFTLFPNTSTKAKDGSFVPGHDWCVEFSRSLGQSESSNLAENPNHDLEDIFMRELDQELCRLNPLYRTRRTANPGEQALLAPPILKKVRSGTYRSWQEKSGKQGGHFKVPRISSSPEFRAELMHSPQHESRF